jgi:ADP-ribose pyrophosphatase
MDGQPRTGRIDGRRVYDGRIFEVTLDRVRFPDGSEGELETIRHPGAAAVLPILASEDWEGTGTGVVLLRQYRYATGGHLWEVPAGKLDAGEAPETCAQRELEEEAGLRARDLRFLTTLYTTPGFTDERIHLFTARELYEGRMQHERSEFIECHRMPLERALRMVREGEISDAKTVSTLLYATIFEGLTALEGNSRAG